MLPSPPDTRASLIVRLQDAADVAAWNELVAIYGPLVHRLAIRQGLQAADADDVVQEVFSAVAKSVGDWVEQRQRGRFRSWLLGITRHIAINALTRRPHGATGRGGDEPHETLAQIPANALPLSSQFDLEYQREVYRWAAHEVRNSVAEVTWNAFDLSQAQGKSIAEVAEQLGISMGSVYVARSRVMKRLRQLASQFEVTQ